MLNAEGGLRSDLAVGLLVGTGLACLVLGVLVARRKGRSDRGEAAYGIAKGYAQLVKSILQMLIGVAAIGIIFYHSLTSWPPTSKFLLDGISVALAAAAVLELAYTLFTPGPDEALDPLMLTLSAVIVLQLSRLENLSLSNATAALVLMGGLSLLFLVRVFLVDGAGPKKSSSSRLARYKITSRLNLSDVDESPSNDGQQTVGERSHAEDG